VASVRGERLDVGLVAGEDGAAGLGHIVAGDDSVWMSAARGRPDFGELAN
jgi:hypothetical protein